MVKVERIFLPAMDAQLAKHGSYVSLPVDPWLIERLIQRWVASEPRAVEMIADKTKRDGEREFHITIASPLETRQLRKAEQLDSFVQALHTVKDVQIRGIGRAANDRGHEAWFLVVESDAIHAQRLAVGLGHRDLHITIGFVGADVHDQSKDMSTIEYDMGELLWSQ